MPSARSFWWTLLDALGGERYPVALRSAGPVGAGFWWRLLDALAGDRLPAGGHPLDVVAPVRAEVGMRVAPAVGREAAWPDVDLVVRLMMNRLLPRAAAESREPIEVAEHAEDLGGIAREVGPDEVELFVETRRVETRREESAGRLVPVTVATSPESVATLGESVNFLVPLTPGTPGRAVGELRISGVGAVLRINLYRVRPAGNLGAGDVAAVGRSVRVTAVAGRNAWRAIARERQPDDPVRQAIIAEL